MIFSEKEAVWSKYSQQIKVGDIFGAKVGSVEDYGAFVHLRFPDGIFLFQILFYVMYIIFENYKIPNFHLTNMEQVFIMLLD